MMFSRAHLEQIRTGEKTQTRRLWSENYTARPSAGDIRMATPSDRGPFVSHDECDCYIRILRAEREPLGDITLAAVQAEGGYSIAGFRDRWEELHGEGVWDPHRIVDVIEFEYAGREHPERITDTNPSEQSVDANAAEAPQ